MDRENVIMGCLALLMIWLAFNIVAFVHGVTNTWGPNKQIHCTTPVTRIELIFPGKQVGCWFAKPLIGK